MPEPRPSFLKVCFITIRPFALPASTMPVVFGSISAAVVGGVKLNLFSFVLSLFAMVVLHSGANLLSDVNDYKKGLDKVPTPVSGAIVRGYIKPQSGLIASVGLIAVGFCIGLFLVYRVGLPLLVIGVTGILIGIFYTLRPFALKYHALGDFAVFLDFGILGALGAWTVQTGRVSWVPAVWATPMSLLVVAIVHANNWRDIQGDSKSLIYTVASILGDRGSFFYYSFLIFGAFGVIALLVLLSLLIPSFNPKMPYTFLMIFASFPFALRLVRLGARRKEPAGFHQFITLDAGTSLLGLIFGLLATASLIMHWVIQR
jgi:1,4-dihydroxy-2-naphthoate polyprenyltransferase